MRCYNVSTLTVTEMKMSGKEIGYEIRALNNTIRNRINKIKASDATAAQTTRLQAWVVAFVFESEREIYQKDIETEFEIKRSTASILLNTMEKNDLIRRTCVEHDARLKRITLTEKALNMHKSYLEIAKKLEKQLENGLSEEELNAFFATLEKISANARELSL